MSLFEWINLSQLGDERGSLVSIEENSTAPFCIKRVYYIFGTRNDIARGFHAHKALIQMAICVAGKCRMEFDNGVRRECAWLDSPLQGVLIKQMVWHEMHDFSDDCVLMVLASDHYDENDYIRDYAEFLQKM
ncbi:FdtA/QdtA family cupin domain-containing protein [Halomonas sp. YLGW01]|uniref:sugar 3,4-ketoisomerase n=1 Tax=Halomonas sp. YLGW01 TaxID=2773308 RepID=UPI001782B648|nr:FdtA/QdtA family cupin domain-containing protein [Halomonas sp. YLGW01]